MSIPLLQSPTSSSKWWKRPRVSLIATVFSFTLALVLLLIWGESSRISRISKSELDSISVPIDYTVFCELQPDSLEARSPKLCQEQHRVSPPAPPARPCEQSSSDCQYSRPLTYAEEKRRGNGWFGLRRRNVAVNNVLKLTQIYLGDYYFRKVYVPDERQVGLAIAEGIYSLAKSQNFSAMTKFPIEFSEMPIMLSGEQDCNGRPVLVTVGDPEPRPLELSFNKVFYAMRHSYCYLHLEKRYALETGYTTNPYFLKFVAFLKLRELFADNLNSQKKMLAIDHDILFTNFEQSIDQFLENINNASIIIGTDYHCHETTLPFCDGCSMPLNLGLIFMDISTELAEAFSVDMLTYHQRWPLFGLLADHTHSAREQGIATYLLRKFYQININHIMNFCQWQTSEQKLLRNNNHEKKTNSKPSPQSYASQILRTSQEYVKRIPASPPEICRSSSVSIVPQTSLAPVMRPMAIFGSTERNSARVWQPGDWMLHLLPGHSHERLAFWKSLCRGEDDDDGQNIRDVFNMKQFNPMICYRSMSHNDQTT